MPTPTKFPPESAQFSSVPVLEVDKTNLSKYRHEIINAVEQASFLALDCELSGLGDRKKLNAPTIDDRYKNTGLVAKTRSIISLGLSTFRHLPVDEGGGRSWNYSVSTFNILVLCGEDYIVEPGSLKFLVEHGFDFQAQYSRGVPYLRGNDREDKEDMEPLRDVFSILVKAGKPLVLHNGLVDLVFLYHNFWAALPSQLGTFISDLSEMFPGGIYDTKYIADFVSRTQASYLEFVFRKEQRCNKEKWESGRPHVKISWDLTQDADNNDVSWRNCSLDQMLEEEEKNICFNYAHHGHCPEGNSCLKSHNIDSILSAKNLEQEKKRRKRKHENTDGENEKNKVTQSVFNEAKPKNSDESAEKVMTNSGGHRAGYDAFMTGFSFSTFLVHQLKLPSNPTNFLPSEINSQSLVNKVYLVSKDFPLLVQKSSFAKCSVQHDVKMKKLLAQEGKLLEKDIS